MLLGNGAGHDRGEGLRADEVHHPAGREGRGERQGRSTPKVAHDADCTVAAVGTQVTIVGGGSYQWGPELMADLFGTPALAGMHLVLEDIDPAPLPKMEALAHKLNDAMEAKATIAATTDLASALDGADFVIVVHLDRGRSAPWRSTSTCRRRTASPRRSATRVGPGGINRALRNIPVLVGIGKAMEEHCPDAWLFNITNPMTTLTRSVCRETRIKTVGLCHEVGNFCMDLAIALGRPLEAVTASVTGINHFPVLTSLEVDGAGRVRRAARAGRRGRVAWTRWPRTRAARRPRPSPSSTSPSGTCSS